MKIDSNTTITVGLVVAIAGAIFSFGIMYQKVEGLVGVTAKIETKVDRLYDYVFEKEGRTAAK